MLVTGKLFQPSLTFLGKASRAYLRANQLSCCPLGKTRLGRLARDKQSSLLQKFVSKGQKKFYKIGSWSPTPLPFPRIASSTEENINRLINKNTTAYQTWSRDLDNCFYNCRLCYYTFLVEVPCHY